MNIKNLQKNAQLRRIWPGFLLKFYLTMINLNPQIFAKKDSNNFMRKVVSINIKKKIKSSYYLHKIIANIISFN